MAGKEIWVRIRDEGRNLLDNSRNYIKTIIINMAETAETILNYYNKYSRNYFEKVSASIYSQNIQAKYFNLLTVYLFAYRISIIYEYSNRFFKQIK